MRSVGLGVLFVLVGCRCSGVAPVEEATETATGGALTFEPSPELCFWIAPELTEAFPSIEAEATAAAAGWGLPFRSDSNCANWMTIEADELFENPELTAQMRRHTDGYRVLRFRESAVTSGLISDTVDACGVIETDGGTLYQVPMLAILLHEFGHALGLKHTESGLMAARHTAGCDVVWPSADELAAVDAAPHSPPLQP